MSIIKVENLCGTLDMYLTKPLSLLGGRAFIYVFRAQVLVSVLLFPQILSFWTIKSGSITEMLDKCWDLNNMPMYIYPKWLRRLGFTLCPFCL